MHKKTHATATTLDRKRENLVSKTRKPEISLSISSVIGQILHLQRTVGNRAVQRLLTSGLLQTKLTIGQPGDINEQEANRVAEQVIRMPEPKTQHPPREEEGTQLQTKPIAAQITPLMHRQVKEEEEPLHQAKEHFNQSPELTAEIEDRVNSLRGGGQPLPEPVRAFMELRFGASFSRVSVHTDAEAVESAQAANAKAFTIGRDVVFGAGQYAPETNTGKRLLAHELAHTLQQQKGPVNLQRVSLTEELDKDKELRKLKAELDEELKKWAKDNGKLDALDPNHKDYAFTLQEYEYNMTHGKSIDIIPMPEKKKERKTWEKKFKKAYLLDLMIMESGKAVEQKEERSGMIARDLAEAGFVPEAMKIAGLFTDKEQTASVYKGVLDWADKATEEHLKTITRFFVEAKTDLDHHPVMTRLTDRAGDFCRKLGSAKLKAVLDILISDYKDDKDIIDDLAEILIFYPEFRKDFSTWMWDKDKDFLFALLESEYFIEPGYGPTVFPGQELTMKKDMPWVYTYKQKYYVEYLVQLGGKAGVTIPKPKSMKFEDIKEWLDANTERIGEALNKTYPKDPGEIMKVYEQITDIFFHHVERGNIKPDLSGKLAGLGPSDPKKMRIKADCDVLATYAVRLLTSSGFTPVGYLLIVPKKGDGHAVALLLKDDIYYAVSNKEITTLKAGKGKKDEVIGELKITALQVYTEEPKPYKVYYADAGKGGEMPKGLQEENDAYLREDVKAE